jgi:nucleoside-diphosphate-sugar epimerase
MRIIVIGGTGHIGTYLVPRLVQGGHEVICVSRGERGPYREEGIWRHVRRVRMDREKEEKSGAFARGIASLDPEIVIDLICFTPRGAEPLIELLTGRVAHFLSCGTIWVHGSSAIVPTTEAMPRRPFGEYGVQKAALESMLLAKARREGFPATILHPGHIVGEGWAPLNPAGNFNPAVFETLATGRELALPNLGLETVHHVHADDVAQAFCRAIECRAASIGESFHVVSPAALTLRGYAESVSQWFGKTAALKFLPWEEWKQIVSEEDAAATWDHIAHSPCCSIEKAKRMIAYEPRFGSLEAIHESVDWLIRNKRIRV